MSWACSPDFSSKKKPLNDYCDKLYLSYQVGHTKPAPEIFEFMVNDCNIIPSETLFVDDGKNNIVVGQELGFHTYQPLNGEDWEEGRRTENTLKIIGSLFLLIKSISLKMTNTTLNLEELLCGVNELVDTLWIVTLGNEKVEIVKDSMTPERKENVWIIQNFARLTFKNMYILRI